MAREIIRSWAVENTHLAEVSKSEEREVFGTKYRRATLFKTICGTRVREDNVIMQPGSKLRCRICIAIDAREG